MLNYIKVLFILSFLSLDKEPKVEKKEELELLLNCLCSKIVSKFDSSEPTLFCFDSVKVYYSSILLSKSESDSVFLKTYRAECTCTDSISDSTIINNPYLFHLRDENNVLNGKYLDYRVSTLKLKRKYFTPRKSVFKVTTFNRFKKYKIYYINSIVLNSDRTNIIVKVNSNCGLHFIASIRRVNSNYEINWMDMFFS